MIEFKGSIPRNASAFKIHGVEGARITIDVSEQELTKALLLIGLRGKTLRIQVKEEI